MVGPQSNRSRPVQPTTPVGPKQATPAQSPMTASARRGPLASQKKETAPNPEPETELDPEREKLLALMPMAKETAERVQSELALLLDLFSRLESGVKQKTVDDWVMKRHYRRQKETLYQAWSHMKSFGKRL